MAPGVMTGAFGRWYRSESPAATPMDRALSMHLSTVMRVTPTSMAIVRRRVPREYASRILARCTSRIGAVRDWERVSSCFCSSALIVSGAFFIVQGIRTSFKGWVPHGTSPTIAGSRIVVYVLMKLTTSIRPRAGVEAIINHLRTDHRMNRCRYKGCDGDRMNVSWAMIVWNTAKWLRSPE
uniref:Transposase n=1 Tax=Leptospirillum sp. Group II '5-way CG' TaxID=419541 RepID=B6ASG8_9BACT|nr:MAG: Hypothetical protein CGL2_10065006 [Leptospirillum sp. Group II '5-way CG']